MSEIVIIGGTGYAGAAIAREAVGRGHGVTAISRTAPSDPVDGVRYVAGAAATALDAVDRADVVVGAISARGSEPGAVPQTYRSIAAAARRLGARLIVVGGFGSLRPAPGAPRFAESDAMPPQIAAVSREMLDVLLALQDEPDDLDWVYVSPPQQFGAHAPEPPATGGYRLGGDVALPGDGGPSAIGGPDFALAIVDEIDRGIHHRAHLTVAS